jgi:hypothetical protein
MSRSHCEEGLELDILLMSRLEDQGRVGNPKVYRAVFKETAAAKKYREYDHPRTQSDRVEVNPCRPRRLR